jgi:hypothetical protein
MTTYIEEATNKLRQLTSAWSEKPPLPSILDDFGKLEYNGEKITIDTRWVPFDAFEWSGVVKAYDEFIDSLQTEMKTSPGMVKTKMFQWGIELRKRRFLDIAQNPYTASLVQKAMDKNDKAMAVKIAKWCSAGPLVTDTDYDIEWAAPIALRSAAAGNTVSKPQDMCDTPGTANNLAAAVMTGGSHTANFLQATVYKDIETFSSKINSSTDEMLINNDGSDMFDWFVNPRFAQMLKNNYVWDGTNYLSKTFAEDLAGHNVRLRPTNRVSYTYTTTNTMTGILVANLKENVLFSWVSPYTVDEWTVTPTKASTIGWGIGIAAACPHTFDEGTTWEKAVIHTTVTPYTA